MAGRKFKSKKRIVDRGNAPVSLKFRWPDRSSLSRRAFKIIRALRGRGYEAFVAGGAVRDALLKRPIEEIDIATSARPETVEKLFPVTIPTGKKHGTITVRTQSTNYEVTTYRVEGPYRDYRRPSRVRFVRSAAEDARRRDFTINALFYDPAGGVVLDYVGGIAHLSHRRIVMVGDPDQRIGEDALRMLRAVRLAAILDFELPKETRKAIERNAGLITKISAERIKAELDRMLLHEDRAAVGFGLLDIVGLLKYILPEVKNLQGVAQPKNQHSEGDVYAHSLLCLEQIDQHYDLPTRYALLFHDLGKPVTKKILNNKITFYDHQQVGAVLASRICQRLRFGRADTEKIIWLVRHHMVPNDFKNMRLATRRKWGLHPHFWDLLLLYRADVLGSIPSPLVKRREVVAFREGKKILQEVRTQPVLRRPLVSGLVVMKALRINPGPQVGKILRFLEEKKLAGEIKTRRAALNFIRKNARALKNF